MYHSVTFYTHSGNSWVNPKNTWSDWHLIPAKAPSIKAPDVMEKLIEVPGRDGLLDITEAVSGKTNYGNSSGSWEFYIVLDDYFNKYWNSAYECYLTVKGLVHGKRLRISLDDIGNNVMYEGRFKVESFDNEEMPKITIGYSLNPFEVS